MSSLTQTRASLVAFVTAFAILFVSVLVHRIVSAKFLNNYAFFVISLTMLGFAFSGTILTRILARSLRDQREYLIAFAALFCITMIGGVSIFYRAPGGASMSYYAIDFILDFARWVPLSLLFIFPFTFAGLMLGMLLSAPDLPARRIYSWDLIGSASGALAVVPAIRYLGVELGLVAVCAMLIIAVTACAPPRSRSSFALVAIAVAVLVAAAAAPGRVFDLRYPEHSMLAVLEKHFGKGKAIEHSAWDPLSRIDISRLPPRFVPECRFVVLVGTDPAFHRRFSRIITQNNHAFTFVLDYDGKRESLKGIEDTLYAAAYVPGTVQGPRALVVGVGGGFDILTALYFGAREIIGVEVNSATIDILRGTHSDLFRAWVGDPRVSLVNAEGRQFLLSSMERYDTIQLSGVDSYSGNPGAAHVFSESYLYTQEAFDLYLSRLTEGGVLNVMRLEHQPPREMLRVLIMAIDALRRAGAARPAHHIVMLSAAKGSMFTAMLLKRTPFTAEEIARIERWTEGRTFFVSAAPAINDRHENLYQVYLSLPDREHEAAFISEYRYDISPVDDDRPFFFKYSFWSHLFRAGLEEEILPPVMELSVMVLLAIAGLVALLCILIPLRLLAAGGLSATHAPRHALYFGALGTGYMTVEIALLQKFGLFLGHPNYAISVVLAALLFASGIGALASARLAPAAPQGRRLSYILGGLILTEYFLCLPLLPALMGVPFAAKAGIVLALIAPLGVCMGAFFPAALDRLKVEAPEFVPWAWGINGIFSVIAPIAGVALAMTWGINALLLSAIPMYLMAGFARPAATTR